MTTNTSISTAPPQLSHRASRIPDRSRLAKLVATHRSNLRMIAMRGIEQFHDLRQQRGFHSRGPVMAAKTLISTVPPKQRPFSEGLGSPPDCDPALGLVERILAEGALGFAEAARECRRVRKSSPPHPSTLTRWFKSGVRSKDGLVIRLEAIRIDGRRFATSLPAILRFLHAIQETSPAQSPPATRAPTKRQRESAAAGEELSRLGIR